MANATTEKKIWDLLAKDISNPYGIAGIMGNLMAESSLDSMCMTGSGKKKWKNAAEYVGAINTGSQSQDAFANDGIAFGLVQWYYHKRKSMLYEYARGKNIGSIETQIGYLVKEMSQHYKTAWNTVNAATSVTVVSDTVMLKYEKPGTTTEAAKQKRRNYAERYFNVYGMGMPEPEKEQSKEKMVTTIADKVFIRVGKGTNYSASGRVPKGSSYSWVATAENGWHAIKFGNPVLWISGEFTEVK